MTLMVIVVLIMNEVEKETIKNTIKELIDLTKVINSPDSDGAELEKRLKDVTHILIDIL